MAETKASDSFLQFILTYPDLLPPATVGDHVLRELVQIHPCLRCGHLANLAVRFDTSAGMRWLDICNTCADWLTDD